MSDVCGFFFRDPPQYTPPPNVAEFLRIGPPPIYIGFGSIVIDDPEKMTAIILEAVRACNVRAIISRGWSKLKSPSYSSDVLFIDDCPHEWLFQHVSAVVHHGGAGTTACGLRNARPTAIVPFFGDQTFWGEIICAAGAGPPPIPYKLFTAIALRKAILVCLSAEAVAAASNVAFQLRSESGVEAAVESFHRNLPSVERLRCDMVPNQPAAWRYRKGRKNLKLSKIAAEILCKNNKINRKRLKVYRSNPTSIPLRRWDPITAISSSSICMATGMVTETANILIAPWTHLVLLSRSRYRSRWPEAATKAILEPAKSIVMVPIRLFKGTLVDIPLAMTDGLRQTQKFCCGEKAKDHGPVTDCKSGFEVAGKCFVGDLCKGWSGLVVQPYRSAKDGGGPIAGLGGLAKGVVGVVAGSGSGMWLLSPIVSHIFQTVQIQ